MATEEKPEADQFGWDLRVGTRVLLDTKEGYWAAHIDGFSPSKKYFYASSYSRDGWFESSGPHCPVVEILRQPAPPEPPPKSWYQRWFGWC